MSLLALALFHLDSPCRIKNTRFLELGTLGRAPINTRTGGGRGLLSFSSFPSSFTQPPAAVSLLASFPGCPAPPPPPPPSSPSLLLGTGGALDGEGGGEAFLLSPSSFPAAAAAASAALELADWPWPLAPCFSTPDSGASLLPLPAGEELKREENSLLAELAALFIIPPFFARSPSLEVSPAFFAVLFSGGALPSERGGGEEAAVGEKNEGNKMLLFPEPPPVVGDSFDGAVIDIIEVILSKSTATQAI
mmetsp:Transcript_43014/g.69317  ORF Transcript_43014/g.69317 Transcript_43014/m.69317 type:complete len:249 (-) Transcript_43014:922-1668(-)